MNSIDVAMNRSTSAGKGILKLVTPTGPVEPKTGTILDIPVQMFADTISLVCASGCALMLSATSDGGAISITLYVDTQRQRAYATTADELRAAFEAVRAVCEGRMTAPTVMGRKSRVQAR